VQLIEAMRNATAGLPLPEVIAHVIEHSGLTSHYRNEKEGADRIENLDELVNAAAMFVEERATPMTAFARTPVVSRLQTVSGTVTVVPETLNLRR